jgi:hypothetical protein
MTIEPVSHKLATQPLISNRAYDALKQIAQIWLPAIGALYFGLAEIWHLPMAPEVVGSITVIDTFLGGILALSTQAYNASDAKYDGEIDVSEPPGGTSKKVDFGLNTHPDDWGNEVIFKVNYK